MTCVENGVRMTSVDREEIRRGESVGISWI